MTYERLMGRYENHTHTQLVYVIRKKIWKLCLGENMTGGWCMCVCVCVCVCALTTTRCLHVHTSVSTSEVFFFFPYATG